MEFDHLIRLSTAQVSDEFPPDFREDLIWLLSAYQAARDELDLLRARAATSRAVAAALFALAADPTTPPALGVRLARLGVSLTAAGAGID
jgi:hypothetical protein